MRSYILIVLFITAALAVALPSASALLLCSQSSMMDEYNDAGGDCHAVCGDYDACNAGYTTGPCESDSCLSGETCVETLCVGCTGPPCDCGEGRPEYFHKCEPAPSECTLAGGTINSEGLCCGDEAGEGSPFSEPENSGGDQLCFDGSDNDCNNYLDCDDATCCGVSADIEETDANLDTWTAPADMVAYSGGETARVSRRFDSGCDPTIYTNGETQDYFSASSGDIYTAQWRTRAVDHWAFAPALGCIDKTIELNCEIQIKNDAGGVETIIARSEPAPGSTDDSMCPPVPGAWTDQGPTPIDWHHLETKSCPACPSSEPEECDSLDNDNDGEIDEDFPNLGTSCGAEGCGFECTEDGSGTECIFSGTDAPPAATEDVCNDGLDNDCDGDVDCEDADCADYSEPPVPKSKLASPDWTAPYNVSGNAYADGLEFTPEGNVEYESWDVEREMSCALTDLITGEITQGKKGRTIFEIRRADTGEVIAHDLGPNSACSDCGGFCSFTTTENPVNADWEWEEAFECPPECIDGDNDDYNVTGGICGAIDCDDTDPTIHATIPCTDPDTCSDMDMCVDSCPALYSEVCDDYLDNDCDGDVDCDDADCSGFPGDTSTHDEINQITWTAPAYVSGTTRADRVGGPGTTSAWFTAEPDITYRSRDLEKRFAVPGTHSACGQPPPPSGTGCFILEHTYYQIVKDDGTNEVVATNWYDEHCGDSCGTASSGQGCWELPSCASEEGETSSNINSDWHWEETSKACACIDADGDGYSVSGSSCGTIDCDDSDPDIYPGATELCGNGLDDDCDGLIDCEDDDCAGPDDDADGEYSWTNDQAACPLDCDDTNAARAHANTELCNDGFDNDCDAYVDEADSECTITLTLTPNPASPSALITANTTPADGAFHAGDQKLFICNYQGCDPGNGCLDTSDIICADLHVNGTGWQSCEFTAPADPSFGPFRYYACLGENDDDALLDMYGAGHCSDASSHTPGDEDNPARYYHEIDDSVEDCNDHNYSSCDWCEGEGTDRLYTRCDDYWCDGPSGSAACQASGSDWYPKDELCTYARANTSTGFRGLCGGNACGAALPYTTYLCHVDRGGSPIWSNGSSLSTSYETGVLGRDAWCSDGYDNDCDGLIDCADDGCDCEADHHENTCTYLGFTWTPWNGGNRSCCGDDVSGEWHEDDPYASPEARCADGKDDDCDWEVDWDTQDWNGADAWDSRFIHGDEACAINLTRLDVPADATPGEQFQANCTVNDPGTFNSVDVYTDEDDDGHADKSADNLCVWDAWASHYSTNPTTGVFNCTSNRPLGSNVRIICEVNESKSYNATGPLAQSIPLTGCVDADNDGHDANHPIACPSGDDCDDGDPNRYPGMLEICDNGIDEDCDGADEPCAAGTRPVSRIDLDDAMQLATYPSPAGHAWDNLSEPELFPKAGEPAGAVPIRFGWLASDWSGMGALNTANKSLLGRDAHISTGANDPATFLVELLHNATFLLNLYFADHEGATHQNIEVRIEDEPQQVVPAFADDLIRTSTTADVSDGNLTLHIRTLDPTEPWRLNAIELLVTCDSDSDTFENEYCGGADCADLNPCHYPTNPNPYCDCDYVDRPPQTEICDGYDNDCDCIVDEDAPNCHGHVAGYVKNEYGVHIGGALVSASIPQGSDVSEESDAYGWYRMELPTGERFLSATMYGFQPDVRSVKIEQGLEKKLNFTLVNGSCNADCTDWEGRCDPECEGFTDAQGNTCHFFDEHTTTWCEGKEPGSQIYYNSTAENEDVYVTCCEGNPSTGLGVQYRPPLEVEGNMSNLVKFSTVARYGGEPVKLHIFVWDE